MDKERVGRFNVRCCSKVQLVEDVDCAVIVLGLVVQEIDSNLEHELCFGLVVLHGIVNAHFLHIDGVEFRSAEVQYCQPPVNHRICSGSD